MEDYDKTDRMFEHEFSPEMDQQIDAMFQDVFYLLFNTKEDFEREIMWVPPDQVGQGVANLQEIADAFQLYRKRYRDGRELDDSEAEEIVSGLFALASISFYDDSDDLNDTLADFDALPEEVQLEVTACWLKVSEDINSDKEDEMSDAEKAGKERIYAKIHLMILEQHRSIKSKNHDASQLN
jgi:hypothetical protein